MLRMAERCQRETAFYHQARLGGEQSHNDSHLVFRYNPAEDYGLSQHVLISTLTEVYPYCKTLKFNGKTICLRDGLGSNPREGMDVCKCIIPLWHGSTLNSHRAASPLVRLVKGEEKWESPDNFQGVLPQN
ncbi:uncharacterized protein TNCV_1341541 [Trichonephila clavipes]|uniref:Uncharacterized protein n=1 Tax=Trichonephila clavipes TaxID=2585209 RepID=A0A8X6RT28_TRICX|nr:uncharacterized protein TNCV_1341541 [Trichonephila clavipes]